MKRLLSLLFPLFLLYPQLTNAQYNALEVDSLSHSSQVSILTCTPRVDETYTVFGHSAMRIVDPEHNVDYVFNYGVFNFYDSNFILHFAEGKTDYMVVCTRFDEYIIGYQRCKVTVYQQFINLTRDERQKIWHFLKENIKLQNRTYRYNVFFNNCTTKLTNIIEFFVKEDIIYPVDNVKQTYRQLINQFTQNKPWLTLGVNLALGSKTDQTLTLHQKMFLPLYQMATLDNALVARGSQSCQPLVTQKNIVTQGENKTDQQSTLQIITSPLAIGLLLLLLSIFISIHQYKHQSILINKIFDFMLFAIVGVLGLLLLFLMQSSHPYVKPNYNIIWLNPFSLALAFLILIKSCDKVVYYYQTINTLLLTAFLIAAPFLTQKIEWLFIPFIACIWLRSIMMIVMFKRNHKLAN